MRRRLRTAVKEGVVAVRRTLPIRRRLPAFVIVGAQRAGTTSLFAQLAAHPQVLPGLRKELHHFDRPPRSLAWYRACFPSEARHRALERRLGAPTITGEATPFYLLHPAVPGRMAAVLPDIRIIVLLRDPVRRAVSAYHLAVRIGREFRPMAEALDPAAAETLSSEDTWFDRMDCPARLRGYLARGRYAGQLARWFRAFAPEQVLILESLELAAGTGTDRVLRFLQLETPAHGHVADRNLGRYPEPDPAIVARLSEYFRPHNEELFDLLGRRWDWG